MKIQTVEQEQKIRKRIDRTINIGIIVFCMALIACFEKIMPGQIGKDIEAIIEFICSKLEELCSE